MKKRKRKLKKQVYLILIILLVLGVGCMSYYGYKNIFKENVTNNENSSNNKGNIIDEPKDEVYNLKFLATGDGLIHSVIYETYKKNNDYDFSPALEDIKDITKDYDILYYNQETPVGLPQSGIKYSGYPQFFTPSRYVDAMIDVGFNTISLASNHSFDKGENGVLKTLEYFKSTDTLYSGMNESNDHKKNYIIKEKNNITYAMLSYTTLTNGLNTPANKKYLVNVYDEEQVKEDVLALREKVDVLMVAMHWGVEYQLSPNEEQIKIANYLSSLGVDIVIGNHPHVLQPITKINNTIVMYSLGNFISNQYGNGDYSKLIGFLATLDIKKTVTKDKEVIMEFSNLGGELIFTKYDGDPINTAYHKNHKVIPFSKMKDDTYLKDYERLYNKYSGILKNMGEEINIAPLGSR